MTLSAYVRIGDGRTINGLDSIAHAIQPPCGSLACEPLLRRDVPEILEDLSTLNLHLTLVANGTKALPQLVERPLSPQIFHLHCDRSLSIRGAVSRPIRTRAGGLVVGTYHWNVGTCDRLDDLVQYDRSRRAASTTSSFVCRCRFANPVKIGVSSSEVCLF